MKKLCHRSILFFLCIASFLHGEEYEILGIGAPCIDILFQVNDEFLNQIQAKKGASEHLGWEIFYENLQMIHSPPTYVPGGSCSNTIKGLKSLGVNVAFCGKIGKDEVGQKYLDHLNAQGIISKMIYTDTPTQQIGVLITPDYQRTFRVFPGASVEMKGTDLQADLFTVAKHVHIEGYAFHNGDLIEKTILLAKSAGATVSLDLANFEVVKKYKEMILSLMPEIDIIFANEEEACALTGLSPQESCAYLNQMCKVAVVLLGEQGCLVGCNQKIYHSPGIKANVVDTTGAGDLFASGFLYGYLNHYPISKCADFGNLIGSSVVEVIGAEIPSTRWEVLRQKLK